MGHFYECGKSKMRLSNFASLKSINHSLIFRHSPELTTHCGASARRYYQELPDNGGFRRFVNVSLAINQLSKISIRLTPFFPVTAR